MNTDIAYKFEKIYEAESDAIFRFCLVRVSNRDQARDITQETFLRLWSDLSKDQAEIRSSRAFLFTIARRLIIDWYRKKKSVSFDAVAGDAKSDIYEADSMKIDDTELAAEGRYLIEKLQELPDSYREIVYLRFVEGLLPQEIGEILGISANAASVRVSRGIEELRKITGYDKENNE